MNQQNFCNIDNNNKNGASTKEILNEKQKIDENTATNEIIKIDDKLTEGTIDHKLWIEQPENFPTCLAVRPYPKDQVQKFFKGLKLYKN